MAEQENQSRVPLSPTLSFSAVCFTHLETDPHFLAGKEEQPVVVRVMIQCHRGTTGGIPARLWVSQAAAHLCDFCLCDDILAVPISHIFFFPLFSQAEPRNSLKIISCQKQRVKEGSEKEETAQVSVYAIQMVTGAQSRTHTHLLPAPGTWAEQQCPCRAQGA